MWLVLCASCDHAALWAYRGLRVRGLEPLELVLAESLAAPTTVWDHRVGAAGVSVEIVLGDGRTVRSEALRGTLNRLMSFPPEHLAAAQAEDREYATQELQAFYTSWLYALPGRVLNPATSQGLCGRWLHPTETLALASRAGLPIADYRLELAAGNGHGGAEHELPQLSPFPAPAETAIVVGREVVADGLPPALEEGCRRLAALAETPILGVDFAAGADGGKVFAGATPAPDLSRGGEPVLDALAAALRGEEAA